MRQRLVDLKDDAVTNAFSPRDMAGNNCYFGAVEPPVRRQIASPHMGLQRSAMTKVPAGAQFVFLFNQLS